MSTAQTSIPEVVVLMSTYNGAAYLQEQIESILAQRGVRVRLLVRDDGSQDGTATILDEYSQRGALRYQAGENLGFARSFQTVCRQAPWADYYAFADQDDVWLPDKLCRQIRVLERYGDTPAVCLSDFTMADQDLTPLPGRHSAFPVSYGGLDSERLQKAVSVLNEIAGFGCTQVWNRPLQALVCRGGAIPPIPHDYVVGMLGIFCGQLAVLAEPTLLYRQHEHNASGARSGLRRGLQTLKRRAQVLSGHYELTACHIDEAFLGAYGAVIPPAGKAVLERAVNYRAAWGDTLTLAFSEYLNDLPPKARAKAFLKILLRRF